MSYVAKSKKSFQPKAPARRAPTSASNTPSVRGSQEPSRVSETPQPSTIEAPPTVSIVVNEAAQTANVTAHATNARAAASDVTTTARPAEARPIAVVETHINPPDTRTAPRDREEPLPIATTTTQLVTPTSTQLPLQAHGATTAPSAIAVKDTTLATLPTQSNSLVAAPDETPVARAAEASPQLPTPAASQSRIEGQPTQEEGANALLQLSQADSRSRSSRQQAAASNGATDVATDVPEPTTAKGGKVQNVTKAKSARRTKTSRKRKSPMSAEEDAEQVSENNDAETTSNKRRQTKQPSNLRKKAMAKTPKTPRASIPRKKAAATTKPRAEKRRSAEDDANAIVADAVRPRRKRKRAIPETAADDDGSDESQDSSPQRREVTPENAEKMKIDQETTTLLKLPSIRTGIIGERERKLRKRDEDKRAKDEADQKLSARALALGDEEPPEDDAELIEWLKSEAAAKERKREEEEERQRIYDEEQEWSHKPSGRYGARRKRTQEESEPPDDPVLDIVDGDPDENDYQYTDVPLGNSTSHVQGNVINLNPNAGIVNTLEAVPVTTTEENDISKQVNYGSYRHKERVFSWSADAYNKLFEGLSIFGLDFGMIATIIPGSSRMQVKKKFEKLDRNKETSLLITEALRKSNRKRITVAEIEEVRGKKLVDPDEFDRETKKREDAMRKEKEDARKEAEAQMKNRGRAEIEDGDDGDEAEEEVTEEVLENRDGQDEEQEEDEVDEDEFESAVRAAQIAQEAEVVEDDQAETRPEADEGQHEESAGVPRNKANTDAAPDDNPNTVVAEPANADVAVRSIEDNTDAAPPVTRGRKASTRGRSTRGKGRGRGQ